MKPTPQRTANGNGDVLVERTLDRRGLATELGAAAGALQRAARLLDVSPSPVDSSRNGLPTPIEDRVTAKQLGAIHAIARRAELSREDLTKILRTHGKDEASRLTRSEASDVIDRLRALVGD